MGPTRTDYEVLADQYAAHRKAHPGVVTRLAHGLGPASRVLEIGCGTGNYLAAIRQATECECVGLDPSPNMLARLRARSLPIRAVEGRAEQVERVGEEFDLIYSVDVIHHVEDRDAAFLGAYRVLRKGGHICTVTESEGMLRTREPQSVYFPGTVDVELRRYPSIQALQAEMTRAGFDSLHDEVAEYSYEITDAQAYRDRVFSSLLHISDESFRLGLARLEADLRQGPIRCTSRYVLLWGTKRNGANQRTHSAEQAGTT